MKVVILISVLLIETVLSSIVTSYTGCTEADDYTPDPSDCRKFFRCANGFSYSFTCAPGTAFDPVLKICNYIELVTHCDSKQCSNENDYTQDLNDCRNFYRCLNNELVSFQCPMETIFDSILKMCVCSYPESNCPVVSGPNTTIPNKKCNQTDDYSPDTSDCRKFFRCANGILYSYTCAPGTAFDPVMQICNYEDQVSSCNNYNTIKGEKGCTQADDYSPDPTDCRKFFRCSNGQLYSFICADGTAFDPILKICNHAQLVAEYCNSIALSTPSPITNEITCTDFDSYKPDLYNCNKYYYCENGTIVAQTCPIGYIYEPELKICFCSEVSTFCYFSNASKINFKMAFLLVFFYLFL